MLDKPKLAKRKAGRRQRSRRKTDGNEALVAVPSPAPRIALAAEDRSAIEASLSSGMVPDNLVAIAARREGDRAPAVLRLYPLATHTRKQRGRGATSLQPFPTMYWLADSGTAAAVSRLEDRGLVATCEARLAAEPAAAAEYAAAHDAYARQRWAMLSACDVRDSTLSPPSPNALLCSLSLSLSLRRESRG